MVNKLRFMLKYLFAPMHGVFWGGYYFMPGLHGGLHTIIAYRQAAVGRAYLMRQKY
jgi:hypothetical protein